MVNKKYITGAGIFVAAAGFVLIGGLQISKGNAVSAAVQTDAPPTSEKIESLKTSLDKTAQYELAHGCTTTDQFGRKEFCEESKQKVDSLHAQLVTEIRKLEQRSALAIAAVTANIRTLAGDPALEVSFDSTASDPYTAGGGVRIEQYRDAKGFVYLVNPADNKVIQMGPGPGSKIEFTVSPKLSLDKLRAKAENFLAEKIDGFNQVKADFKYREMSKPGNMSYAFRWEAKSVPQGEELAPFVQVVLSPAGDVMSFNDTRSLYSQN